MSAPCLEDSIIHRQCREVTSLLVCHPGDVCGQSRATLSCPMYALLAYDHSWAPARKWLGRCFDKSDSPNRISQDSLKIAHSKFEVVLQSCASDVFF